MPSQIRIAGQHRNNFRTAAPTWRLVLGAALFGLTLTAADRLAATAPGTALLAAALVAPAFLFLGTGLRPTEPPAPAPGNDEEALELPENPEHVLVDAAEAIARSLALPYAALELAEEPGRRHEWGREAAGCVALPLTYGGLVIGRLLVGPRAVNRGLTCWERQRLEAISAQVSLIAHAVGLTRRALRAHDQILAAREEERRDLRRNLHDQLGPTLAAMALKLDAARNLLDRDRPAVDELLDGMRRQSQGAITEIRRLTSGLRPPALDQLGVIGAIRECADHYASDAGLHVRVDAPERIEPLPAAVEVAALRIVQDALSNVARHAGAQNCLVRLVTGEELVVEVHDDGAGLPPGWRMGAGVRSMHERAREVGGTCALGAPPAGGVRVSARLPLSFA